jgi:peptidoglycan glycosyltransferase
MTGRLPDTPDRDKIRTLSKILLVAFMLVAVALLFWGVVRASSILSRNDNPRLVEAELRIQRGAIVDRNETILAQNIGPLELQQRFYPFPEIGPAVGYYSLTHGTAGAEDGFDSILRGESENPSHGLWQQILHLPQIGNDVQLALDADLQEKSRSLLENRDGAVLLLEMPRDGSDRAWIRVLSSYPGYDPNLLDEQFDELGANERAPLLNRVTQGQYQPGLLLQPLILASALEQGLIQINDLIKDPQHPVAVNGIFTECASQPPDLATWADVLFHRCPAPMQDLADKLGIGGLDAAFASFGLDRDPVLEIDTTTTPDDPLADPLLAGIGQDNLSITPLKIGLAMAALAGQGTKPQPQLAMTLMEKEGGWQELTLETEITQAVSLDAARAIRQSLPQQDGVRGFSPLVISGPDGSTNAWYVGMSAAETADYVVVVVLEGSNEELTAQKIGRGVISAGQ